MEIIWKEVQGYNGDYKISDSGLIVSFKCKNPLILKHSIDKGGYFRVCLCKEGLKNSFNVHVLVAIHFLNHIPSGRIKIVDHKDNDKSNNHKNNLQIITTRKNLSKDKKNKTSKYTGVSWSKTSNKWNAKIYKNGKLLHLGYFRDEEDASEIYQSELNKIKSCV